MLGLLSSKAFVATVVPCATAFGPALATADVVVIADVYPAGESPLPGVTGKLVADAVAGHDSVHYEPSRRTLAATVAGHAGEGDLVLLMGAGDITGVADELAELLEARL